MFRSLLEKLTGLMGLSLTVTVYAFKFILTFMPLYILSFPFWVNILILAAIGLTGFFGNIIYAALWCWAFVVALKMPLTPFIITFFVLFVLNALNVIQAVLRTIFSK